MKERKRERNKERNKEKQKTLLISHNYNKLDFTLIIIHHILYAIFFACNKISFVYENLLGCKQKGE